MKKETETIPIPVSARSDAVLLPRSLVPVLFTISDVVAIWLASILASRIYPAATGAVLVVDNLSISVRDVAIILFLVLAWSRNYYMQDGRPGWNGVRSSTTLVLMTWTIVFAVMTAAMFIFKVGASFSRGDVILLFVIAPALLISFRALMEMVVQRGFRSGVIVWRDVAILMIGPNQSLAKLGWNGASEGLRLRKVWTVNAVKDEASAERLSREIMASLHGSGVTDLLIAAPASRMTRVKLLADALRLAPLRVRLLVDAELAWLAAASAHRVGGSMVIELSREPINRIERAIKRCFDIVVASLALIILAPLLALVAVAVRLETPGPVLFRQWRDGFGDRPFMIFKFRSMRVTENGPVVVQAKRGDARVTRVGQFIRRTSIDELPQLINVLRGDMSIIGPRPHAVAHGRLYSDMIGDYAHRHHVKPGLTGWAQVNGSRGETPTVDSMKQRVDLDTWYIGNWSFWLDVKIMLMTIRLVLTGRNAY